MREAAPRARSHWSAWGRHLVLFVLTAASVFLTGALASDSVSDGLKLVAALMSILLAHEMGHYVACRIYGIDATLPFFIPAPLLNPLVGTFGAVIRIRAPFPNRRALFDVGVAGPLAGFLVCLPVLALAMLREARVVPTASAQGLPLGSPLLFDWAFELLRGAAPADHTIMIGALGQAAWFGLLVTGLNLLPVGQLDGGHATYALFRDRAHHLARGVWWVCVGLIVVGGPSWILWVILVRLIGLRHPPTLRDWEPLGLGRVAVAILCLAVFAVSFLYQPMPFSWLDVWRQIRH
jgi:membrane-associated protease RseP (regulator of RpoE activity)